MFEDNSQECSKIDRHQIQKQEVQKTPSIRNTKKKKQANK